MALLFEFGNKISISDRISLESYLCSLWKQYKDLWPADGISDIRKEGYQPFLTFDGNHACANNYVGFIQCENELIEIYPKVFRDITGINKELMHNHLFYWFSYCSRIKFPFNPAYLDNFQIDSLPELIIYLIARQFSETISTKPYNTYEEISEALLTPRGKINFSRYIINIASGKHHLIECDYEPFIFDNKLNRIIKYSSRLLLDYTRIPETQLLLNNVLNILDEVEDRSFTSKDVDALKVLNFFEEYEELKHCCKMVIDNRVFSSSEYELKNLSLLFPMEYIFEDFIAGFIRENFKDTYMVEYQKSDLYLQENPNAFRLKQDILLTNKATKEIIIIDAKYKLRKNIDPNDSKRGVSSADMYQVLSYSYRRGSNKVVLMYPNTSETLMVDHIFTIKKADKSEEIKVKVVDVPFWSDSDQRLVCSKLKVKLSEILENDWSIN